MISVILSVAVLLLVSFGGVVEATRKRNLRLQQNLATHTPPKLCHEKTQLESNKFQECAQCVDYDASELVTVNAHKFNELRKIKCSWTRTPREILGVTSRCGKSADGKSMAQKDKTHFTNVKQCATVAKEDRAVAERTTCHAPTDGENACKQCIGSTSQDPDSMAGKNPCVWTHYPADGKAKCRAFIALKVKDEYYSKLRSRLQKKEKAYRRLISDEKGQGDNTYVEYITDAEDCYTTQKRALKNAVNAMLEQANHKKSWIDPTLADEYTESVSSSDFQKISGNKGYCWRYAAAVSFGIPYLVFESMLKTIQIYLKGKYKTPVEMEVVQYRDTLLQPLSLLDKPEPLNQPENVDPPNHDAGGATAMIEAVRKFESENKDMTIYDGLESKVKKKEGRNKEMDKKLRKLIGCVDVKQMEHKNNYPLLEDIKGFLAQHENSRVILKEKGIHVGTLLLFYPFEVEEHLQDGEVAPPSSYEKQLYFTDGNGADAGASGTVDGKLYPFYEDAGIRPHTYLQVYQRDERALKRGEFDDIIFNVYSVNRDRCR